MLKEGHIFVILSLLAIVLSATVYSKEGFQATAPSLKIVVCIMCVCPNEIVMKFATKISKLYETYVVCDDINCSAPENADITFIKISDQEVTDVAYNKSNVAISKVPSAWDKALYYFCKKDTSPDHVWFIEEDVFIPRASIIKEIDDKYPDADLIAKQHVSQAEDPGFGWWFDAEPYMKKPLYRSMVCAARLSRALLDKIAAFVKKHGRLVFIEVMFNTIVHHDKMKLAMPVELSTIIWRHDWNENNVDENHMFHPVKDLTKQKDFRKTLSSVQGSRVEPFRTSQN